MAHLTLRQRIIKLVDARDRDQVPYRDETERGVHVAEILNEVDRAPPAGWEKVISDARAGLNSIRGSLEQAIAVPLLDAIQDQLAELDAAARVKPGLPEMGAAMVLARLSHLAAHDRGMLPIFGMGVWWVRHPAVESDGRMASEFPTLAEAVNFAWELAGHSLWASPQNREISDVAEAAAGADRRMENIDVAARIQTLQVDVGKATARAKAAEEECARVNGELAIVSSQLEDAKVAASNYDTARRIWEAQHDHQIIVAESNGQRLNRAMWILHNMALERVGFWRQLIARWAIAAEPLRNDAANLVREFGFRGFIPEGTRLVGDDWRDEPIAQCESCGAGIRDGEAYHRGTETDHCDRCAPTYGDLLASPGSFMRDEDAEEYHTAESAKEIVDAHLAAGGSLKDRMVSQ